MLSDFIVCMPQKSFIKHITFVNNDKIFWTKINFVEFFDAVSRLDFIQCSNKRSEESTKATQFKGFVFENIFFAKWQIHPAQVNGDDPELLPAHCCLLYYCGLYGSSPGGGVAAGVQKLLYVNNFDQNWSFWRELFAGAVRLLD